MFSPSPSHSAARSTATFLIHTRLLLSRRGALFPPRASPPVRTPSSSRFYSGSIAVLPSRPPLPLTKEREEEEEEEEEEEASNAKIM